jgi:glycosyltransferase involved in cell wall biosynthesis
MRFSIVIPTYNSKVSLKNTLESLNYQTGYSADDYEVIVSDDGSNDGTYEYIKDVPKNYKMKHIYLERCEKSCRSRTRNEGRRAAQGEIINYMDSDIIVKQDYLSEVDRYFKVSDRFCLLGNRLMIDDPICFDDIKTQKVFSLYPFNPTMYEQLEFRHYLFQQYSYNANAITIPWMQVYSCNIIAAKRWLDEIDGFDENITKWGMEDVEFGYSLYKYGLLFAINPKLEVLHQNHGARNDLIVEKSKVEAYDRNIDYFLKKHPEALNVRKSIAYKFLKGEIPMHKFNIVLPKKDIHFSYNNTTDIEYLKNEILKYVNEEQYNIILEDYLENADLDLWIQLLGKTKSVIRYFPQSKKIDVKEMAAFIDAERERQIERDRQKYLQLA